MKIIENITLYKCDFCKKELKRKHAMINHELGCSNNPINIKACMSCIHLEQIKKDVWFEGTHHPDYGSGGDYKNVSVFKCVKLNKLMYPFNIEKANLPDKYPSTFEDQESMPNKCNSFEENSYWLPF